VEELVSEALLVANWLAERSPLVAVQSLDLVVVWLCGQAFSKSFEQGNTNRPSVVNVGSGKAL